MNKKMLGLIPRRFLCPYCGKWHNWNKDYELGYYDSDRCMAEFECSNALSDNIDREYRIYFKDGYLYYSIEHLCMWGYQEIEGKIPISSIIESTDKPIVTFNILFTAAGEIGEEECSKCNFKDRCLYTKLGDEGDHLHMTITFGFEFEQSDYNNCAQVAVLARKEKELQEREQAIESKERTLKEREDAVTCKEQVSKGSQVREKKENTTMAKKIFNMNMEFGPNKDENIASTLMGIAVKNGDSWRIYDKKKKEITDVGDMQLGNLPIFILPSTKISEGDLIKDSGEYYFVTRVATPKTPTQTLSARTGEMKSVVPIKNVLGFSCYSKVIALSDSLKMGDDFDLEKLAIMSAMCGQTGETSGQMNQLLALMIFKDKLGGDDDTMKLLLMSSILGGNMAGSDNPMMSYLMLDAFMDKKNSKTPQIGEIIKK